MDFLGFGFVSEGSRAPFNFTRVPSGERPARGPVLLSFCLLVTYIMHSYGYTYTHTCMHMSVCVCISMHGTRTATTVRSTQHIPSPLPNELKESITAFPLKLTIQL